MKHLYFPHKDALSSTPQLKFTLLILMEQLNAQPFISLIKNNIKKGLLYVMILRIFTEMPLCFILLLLEVNGQKKVPS
jgi:hypothetical protein